MKISQMIAQKKQKMTTTIYLQSGTIYLIIFVVVSIYHPSGVTGDLKEQTIKCIATKHLVFFYGEESWGHVPFDTIKPFLENFDDLSVNPVQSMTKKKGKGKKMTERNRKHWSMGIISARKDAMKTNKWDRGAWIGLE